MVKTIVAFVNCKLFGLWVFQTNGPCSQENGSLMSKNVPDIKAAQSVNVIFSLITNSMRLKKLTHVAVTAKKALDLISRKVSKNKNLGLAQRNLMHFSNKKTLQT